MYQQQRHGKDAPQCVADPRNYVWHPFTILFQHSIEQCPALKQNCLSAPPCLFFQKGTYLDVTRSGADASGENDPEGVAAAPGDEVRARLKTGETAACGRHWWRGTHHRYRVTQITCTNNGHGDNATKTEHRRTCGPAHNIADYGLLWWLRTHR